MKEQKAWLHSHFVTLTYSDEFVPRTESGLMTFDKSHHQNLFKTLRKNKLRCSYFLCAEYGTYGRRPHYHAIINHNSGELPEMLSLHWRLGLVDCRDTIPERIRYVTGYLTYNDFVDVYKGEGDQMAPYRCMSQGIGMNYLTPEMVTYLKSALSYSVKDSDVNARVGIPRYFRDKVFDDSHRIYMRRMIGNLFEEERAKMTLADDLEQVEAYKQAVDSQKYRYHSKRSL